MNIPKNCRFCLKSFQGYISTRFFLALTAALVVLLLAVYPVTAGETIGKEQKVVTLIIDDFKKLSADPRFDILSRSIPELLSVALLPNDSIKIVPRAKLYANARSMHLPCEDMDLENIMGPDMLKAVDADYLLQGNFFEYRGTIRISSVLQNVRSQKRTIIHPISIDAHDIFPGIGSVAIEVVRALDKLKAISYKIRRFAVPCFQDISEQPSTRSTSLKSDVAMSLSLSLARRRGVSVVGWQRLEKTCKAPPFKGSEFATKLGVDAVIDGSIRLKNGKLFIYPKLYIDEKKVQLDLPGVEGNIDDYFEQKTLLIEKVAEFLDGALTQKGEWRVAELPRSHGNPEELLKQAKSLIQQNDTSLAVLFLQKALSMRPKYPEAYYYLGLIRLDQKRLEDAVFQFKKALKLKRDFLKAHKALAETYARMRLYPESVKVYETILQLKLDLPRIYFKIGNMYFLEGKYKLSEDYYRKAIDQDHESYYWLGVLYGIQGNRDEAVSWFKRTLKIDPENKAARNSLASQFHREGLGFLNKNQYRQAEKQFTQEIKYFPTPDAYYFRAKTKGRIAWKYKKSYFPAIQDYLTALQLTEKNPHSFARREFALLNMTELYILSQSYNEAISRAILYMKEPSHNQKNQTIARTLYVIALILQGQPYRQDLEGLQNQIADGTFRIINWKFDLLEGFVKDNPDINLEAQNKILKLIQDIELTNKNPQKFYDVYNYNKR